MFTKNKRQRDEESEDIVEQIDQVEQGDEKEFNEEKSQECSKPSTDHNVSDTSRRIKLYNIPKYYTISQIKKDIISCLGEQFDSNKDQLTIKKNPSWNFAFAIMGSRHLCDLLIQEAKNKKLIFGKNIIRVEIDNLGNQKYHENILKESGKDSLQSSKSILDQVTPLHSISYDEQLKIKEKEIISILPNEIKTLLSPIISSPQILGYRNKCEFSIGLNTKSEPTVGFTMGLYKDGIVAVESIENCPHVSNVHKDICVFFQEYLRTKSTLQVFDRKSTSNGNWRLIIIRSNKVGDHMVGIQIHPQSLNDNEIILIKKDLIELFSSEEAQKFKIRSLLFQKSTAKSHGISSSDPYELILGNEEFIYEYLSDEGKEDLKFRISLNSFFQVNTLATEKLYGKIKDLILQVQGSKCTLLDLCCGTGTIGICMARYVEKVIGVEMVPDAIEDANFNAMINNVHNIEFICSKLESCIESILDKVDPTHSIVVILDPPRGGVHHSVIESLRKKSIALRINRIIYVSCAPALAVTNLKYLMKEKSSHSNLFNPIFAQTLDLFPHTKHCELIVAFNSNN